jgi:hypothetical protein
MKQLVNFQLHHNPFGKLILTLEDGTAHEGVIPVRAFPITAPRQDISLVSSDGHELIWIDTLDSVPGELCKTIEAELNSREFMPEIQRIVSVSSFATPSIWEVETDRGIARFILKGEDDIRRLAPPALLISDSHGIQFLIRDRSALDAQSRRLLDRFL